MTEQRDTSRVGPPARLIGAALLTTCLVAATAVLPARDGAERGREPPPAETEGRSGPGDLRITGGWLFQGPGDRAIRNPGVLVRNGKIRALGLEGEKAADAPGTGARELKLDEEQYLLPGFIDLHAHYAMDLFGQGRVDETRAYPVLFLANGVTTTFPAGEVEPDEMRELRIAIDRGERIGPRILNSGPYFGSARRGWDPDYTTAEIRRQADHWAARGVRGFKAKGIGPDHLDALIDQAHLHGLTVTGHLGSGYRNSVNPRDAIRMGIDRVEHFLGGDAFSPDRHAYASLVEFDPDSEAFVEIATLYREGHVHFDATVTAYGYFGERDPRVYTYFEDEKGYLTPYMRQIIDERGPRPVNEQFERIYRVKLRTVKAFFDAGGGDLITLGTDHPSWGEYLSGFAVHRQMHALRLAGIPEPDVLRIATINGARALGLGSLLGSIEAGKLADLVVVEGNPLNDIRNTRNVRMVVRSGRVYDSRRLLRSVESTIGPTGPDEEPEWAPEQSAGG